MNNKSDTWFFQLLLENASSSALISENQKENVKSIKTNYHEKDCCYYLSDDTLPHRFL